MKLIDALPKLRALADAATPGPWIHDHTRDTDGSIQEWNCVIRLKRDSDGICTILMPPWRSPRAESNTAFAVHARTALPALVRAVEITRDALDVIAETDCPGCALTARDAFTAIAEIEIEEIA